MHFQGNWQGSFAANISLRWCFQDDGSNRIREDYFTFSMEKCNPTELERFSKLTLAPSATSWVYGDGPKSSSRRCYKGQKIIMALISWAPERNTGHQRSRHILRCFSPRMSYYSTSAHRLWQESAVCGRKWLIPGTSNWAWCTCAGFSFWGSHHQ